MTDGAWDLLVERDDLSRTELIQAPAPEIVTGEVLLSIDRVGVTANNVTYARVGEAMNYWAFFPARAGWGRVPLWGFADVVASEAPAVDVGTRVYGYLPTSSHLVVRPERADAAGFRDASPHRVDLPRPYNVYATTAGDPAYEAEREDLQILYRPLFITSFMLDDFLSDNDFFGAEVVVISSASSKTSYGTAFCTSLRPKRPRLVGLTSAGNVPFTESLNLYDEVVPYDDAGSLPTDRPALYVDVAGNIGLRKTIHSHLGKMLVHDAVVGMTHLDAPPSGGADVPGVHPEFFFAPTHMAKRREDWGPGGIEQRHAQLWREFAAVVEGWVDVVAGTGPEGLREAWLEVLSGRADPRAGHVISL
jgi:hypothetical protein